MKKHINQPSAADDSGRLSLAFVAERLGLPAREEQVAAALGGSARTSMLDLARAGRAIGLELTCLAGGLTELRRAVDQGEIKTPFIAVVLEFGRSAFVPVLEVSGDHWALASSSGRIRTLTTTELAERWVGYVAAPRVPDPAFPRRGD